MNCPRCAGGPSLAPFEKKSMHFLGCTRCHGVLLEKKALGAVVQRLEKQGGRTAPPDDGYMSNLIAASEFTDNQRPIICPRCRYNMYETDNRGVVLDFCLNCQSLWFDDGELQEILKRLRRGERFNLIPLPPNQVDHASGLILHLLRDEFL